MSVIALMGCLSLKERETGCVAMPVRTCDTHTDDEQLQIIKLIAHLAARKVFHIRSPLSFILAGIYCLTSHLWMDDS